MFAKPGCFFAAAFAAATLALLLPPGMAAAQPNDQGSGQPAAAPAPAAAAPAVPPQPSPAFRPGFLHQLKIWWDDSIALFDPSKRTQPPADDNKKPDDASAGAAPAPAQTPKGAVALTGDALRGAVEATKNAATAIVRLPTTRFVEIHERCAKAPNGASDCATAASNGCRAKGFAGGSPLDVRTSENCAPKPSDAGQLPGMQCAPEAVVTRAVCQ